MAGIERILNKTFYWLLVVLVFVSCNKKPVTPNEQKDVDTTVSGINYGTLIDVRDGYAYKTIQIGSQTWMAENLQYGSHLYAEKNIIQTNNNIVEKYIADNDTALADSLGGFYHWKEAMQYARYPRGICPFGWHIPSDNDWKDFEIELGLFPDEVNEFGPRGAGECRDLLQGGGTDFNAVPSGYWQVKSDGMRGILTVEPRYQDTRNSYFWSSSNNIFREISVSDGTIIREQGESNPDNAYCIRCIRDTVDVARYSQLSVRRSSIVHWGISGGNAIPVLFTIMNSGTDTLRYSVACNVDWIRVMAPESGAILWDCTDTVHLEFISSGLNIGTHTADLTITSNSQDNTTKTIRVTLNIYDGLIDDRDGKQYRTVAIGSDTWMLDNLNYGTPINGIFSQTDNSIAEKYMYRNLEANADLYGGLYQWDEAMGYSTMEGVQGICPDGWHIPTKDEFTDAVMHDAVLSGYRTLGGGFGCGGVDNNENRGGYLWLSSQDGVANAWYGYRAYFTGEGWYEFGKYNERDKHEGLCVRCVKGAGANPNSPSIGVTTHAFSHNITVDSTLVDTFSVYNFGNDSLDYTISSTKSWLAIDHSNGNSTGEHDRIIITYDNNLVIGEYNAEIIVSSPDAANTEVIDVQLVVYGKLVDNRDGTAYRTVIIGEQEWMAQNLNIGSYINNTLAQEDNGIIEKYALENLAANNATLGGLYQWNEAMQYTYTESTQGICPVGWHIPSAAEFSLLITNTGGESDSYDQLTIGGSAHFDGAPADYTPHSYWPEAIFWSSTDANTDNQYASTLNIYAGAKYFTQSSVRVLYDDKQKGYCVRCVKN